MCWQPGSRRCRDGAGLANKRHYFRSAETTYFKFYVCISSAGRIEWRLLMEGLIRFEWVLFVTRSMLRVRTTQSAIRLHLRLMLRPGVLCFQNALCLCALRICVCESNLGRVLNRSLAWSAASAFPVDAGVRDPS